MKNLTEILKNETESLRVQYISKTREWATNYYEVLLKRKSWKESDWCDYFGIQPMVCNPGSRMEFLGFPKGFYNTRDSRDFSNMRNEIFTITNQPIEFYCKKQEEKAQLHYEQSILKLTDRITKKDLNIDNLTAKTSHIGVNIEIVLTDGVKTVKAFTIVAEGIIQRPHYRYLIK